MPQSPGKAERRTPLIQTEREERGAANEQSPLRMLAGCWDESGLNDGVSTETPPVGQGAGLTWPGVVVSHSRVS